MIIKLGEELRTNRRTAIAQAKLIEVTRSEEELIFQCCSALGDNIKIVFNSATKDHCLSHLDDNDSKQL